jgi:hypothetical protein
MHGFADAVVPAPELYPDNRTAEGEPEPVSVVVLVNISVEIRVSKPGGQVPV